ncbi:MAG: aminodeoxychorismate lyase, partial [Brevundimonas sp.]
PLGRGIRRSELDRQTAWNTYQIDGLHPTPIANPGKEAIKAVLNPPSTGELFFVADGTGGHAFARTYDEHLANVARWRAIERQRAGLPADAPAPAVPETVPTAPMTPPGDAPAAGGQAVITMNPPGAARPTQP